MGAQAPRAFICGCAGLALSPDELRFLRESDPWALIIFKRNVADRDQLSALIDSFRQCVGRPDAPVLVDQEGGRVQRLGPPHWRAYPAAAAMEARLTHAEAENAARLVARLIAHDLREVGVNVDCAPVLDVAEPETHAVIGSRSFSQRPERVTAMGRAFAEGLLAGGVAPVIKHIPGHGRARADSHHQLPVVDAGRPELERDFSPFAALKHLPMAMTAHVVYASLDPERPATASPVVVKEIIRGAIAFDGLLMSDDVSMRALTGPYDRRARSIFDAGLDIVLHCNGDLDEARAIASESPILAGESLRRANAAAACRGPEPFDVEAGEAQLAKLQSAIGAA